MQKKSFDKTQHPFLTDTLIRGQMSIKPAPQGRDLTSPGGTFATTFSGHIITLSRSQGAQKVDREGGCQHEAVHQIQNGDVPRQNASDSSKSQHHSEWWEFFQKQRPNRSAQPHTGSLSVDSLRQVLVCLNIRTHPGMTDFYPLWLHSSVLVLDRWF